MNAFQFTTATVVAALNAANAYGNAIELLRTEALNGQLSSEDVKAALLKPIASYYSVKLIAKTRGDGLTWDKDAPKYAAAVKAHQRMAADISGKTNSSDEVEIPAELLAAAQKLAKLAAEYEGARSLASKALAAAFAK